MTTFCGFISDSLFSPGRFVAAMTLKTLFAHILMHYDLKAAEKPPRTLRVNGIIFTDPRSKIMLRKRMD